MSLSLNRAFSSSVNMMTKGTSNTSCNHLVKVLSTVRLSFTQTQLLAYKGMVCPRCSASLLGPLPVYKKKASPASYLSNIRSRSRCEKNKRRRSHRWGLCPAHHQPSGVNSSNYAKGYLSVARSVRVWHRLSASSPTSCKDQNRLLVYISGIYSL